MGRSAIAALRNPFNEGGSVEKRGLFGWMGAQPSPQAPGVYGTGQGYEPVAPYAGQPGGMAEPGAAPGGMAEPGAAPGGAMPGAPTVGGEAGAAAQPPGGVPPSVAADAFAAAAGTGAAGLGGVPGASTEAFPMVGDQGPMFLRQTMRFPPVPPPLPPGVPRPGNNPAGLTARSVAAIVPSVRGLKMADNQYPRPVDRVWVSFNYYDGVNQGINDALGAPIKNMQVYRETFGFEKTFLDRAASVGFRIPLNTLTITNAFSALNGTHTSTGNFSSFLKYALYDDGANLFSVGLDMYFPTGPTNFAGYPALIGINAMDLQPFFGYILQRDRLYFQGFNSISVPMDRRLATMYYCSLGLGYYVYRAQNPRALFSFLVPSFETHLNIPLNWVGFQPNNIGGTPNVVDLTFGLNVGVAGRAVISAAYVRPVTGPLPFGGEFSLLLNIPFGGRAGRAFPLTPPPVIGG
jgi:hypothetical protein